jgi:hypothetical protein
MHIIVDGYNLIRRSDGLRRAERHSLEAGRKELVRRLSSYRRMKHSRITVVFDGWEGGQFLEEREMENGVAVIYSRRGEKADEVIKRLAAKEKKDAIIVTSDRGLADAVRRAGSTAVSSDEFEKIMARASWTSPERKDETENRMYSRDGTKKKGPSRRPSKKDKAYQSSIKKL